MYGEPPRTAMLPAVVSTDGQPPRRRLTLSIRAALASIAVYMGALVMLALSSWYDLENLGYELWVYPAIGLFVTGVLLLVMAASTVAMLNGSRLAWRLACGVAAASALGCVALPLIAADETPAVKPDANTLVPILDRYPPTTPTWVRWSEATGAPVLIGGAALATVVLLLPSTRRDLRARQGATG
jgi:hypothetical protein